MQRNQQSKKTPNKKSLDMIVLELVGKMKVLGLLDPALPTPQSKSMNCEACNCFLGQGLGESEFGLKVCFKCVKRMDRALQIIDGMTESEFQFLVESQDGLANSNVSRKRLREKRNRQPVISLELVKITGNERCTSCACTLILTKSTYATATDPDSFYCARCAAWIKKNRKYPSLGQNMESATKANRVKHVSGRK